mmetsp:Transcript_7266/g.17695  ORF Transcript_7266/g.17695 Transcript_7266/m.17695 type:complete len:91 (+) Transcript_7266:557-829(+)
MRTFGRQTRGGERVHTNDDTHTHTHTNDTRGSVSVRSVSEHMYAGNKTANTQHQRSSTDSINSRQPHSHNHTHNHSHSHTHTQRLTHALL